jgi:hypothetical protein
MDKLKKLFKDLFTQGIDVDQLFLIKEQNLNNIIIGLNKTETCSTEELLVRDSLTE